MNDSSSSGSCMSSSTTSRSRASSPCDLPFRLAVVVGIVALLAVVERVDLVLEVLVDLLALDLERGGELALGLAQVAVEDRELLHLLDLREVLVGGFDRLLPLFAPAVPVAVGAVVVERHERDQVGPVVAVDHRLRDDRAVADLLLDVRRRDVLARRGDDDLLRPTGDDEVALLVDLAEVAGVEPAVVVEDLLRLVLEAVVALEDVRAPHEDLALVELLLELPELVGVELLEVRVGLLDGL